MKTEFYEDNTKGILSYNKSPDIGFEVSLNPYRGCEHGCIYCFARPFHEYLGLSAGIDFETKIFVKMNAPVLLREELSAPSWEPQTVVMSGVTDCYQPFERKFGITRRCLEVFWEFRNPIAIITKNALVTRDIDILARMAEQNLARVNFSITTLDPEIARTMEPRASAPHRRLEAVKQLTSAGIPVNVMIAPIIPGLTDEEIPALTEAAAEAGAQTAAMMMVRLPYGVKHLFEDWLEQHQPLRKQKVLNKIRAMRGGKLNEPDFFKRRRPTGEYAEQMKKLFTLHAKKHGLDRDGSSLTTQHFRRVTDQLQLL
ncbi:MAG: PA0069 family radical SAM protein [Alphaproteobacteria bacterium]